MGKLSERTVARFESTHECVRNTCFRQYAEVLKDVRRPDPFDMPTRHALQPGKSFSRPQETPKVSSVMLTEQRDTTDVS
ncbi:hypothetical protein OKW30_007588 [Paraburkholderia sp. Clong3]|uniref:hypothetical protein n=1 Tax=Paraburkholderia sp. Clong3 TaxID=2991061 RepID=UPI003D1A4E8F